MGKKRSEQKLLRTAYLLRGSFHSIMDGIPCLHTTHYYLGASCRPRLPRCQGEEMQPSLVLSPKEIGNPPNQRVLSLQCIQCPETNFISYDRLADSRGCSALFHSPCAPSVYSRGFEKGAGGLYSVRT